MQLLPCACGRSLLVDATHSVPLTPQETAIVQLAMNKPVIDREEIIAAFWGHPDLMPESWYSSLRARLAALRRKTLTFGFVIVHAPLTGKWRCRWRMAESIGATASRSVAGYHATSSEL